MGDQSTTQFESTDSSRVSLRPGYGGGVDFQPAGGRSVTAPAGTIRVVVLEGLPIIREALVAWLNQQAGMQIEGHTGDHKAARAQLARQPSAVLLMDLMAGGRDGLEFIREVRAAHPLTPVLVFSAQDERVYTERVLKAGANGYVMKHEPTENLLGALQLVANGELAVSRQMTLLLLKQVMRPTAGAGTRGVGDLTDRELHVFQMIGVGQSPRKIAENLSLSIKTVETHRENIKNKLGLHSSAEVMRAAALWLGAAG